MAPFRCFSRSAYLLRPVGQDIRNCRYTRIAGDAKGGIWSPDGKAVTYPGMVNGMEQVFLRYLNSPNPVQLTHEKRPVWPVGWSSDRGHLIVVERIDRNDDRDKLCSVARVLASVGVKVVPLRMNLGVRGIIRLATQQHSKVEIMLDSGSNHVCDARST